MTADGLWPGYQFCWEPLEGLGFTTKQTPNRHQNAHIAACAVDQLLVYLAGKSCTCRRLHHTLIWLGQGRYFTLPRVRSMVRWLEGRGVGCDCQLLSRRDELHAALVHGLTEGFRKAKQRPTAGLCPVCGEKYSGRKGKLTCGEARCAKAHWRGSNAA